MKKTKKTLLTSTILSMAAASVNMSSDQLPQKKVGAQMAPVYGPPPYFEKKTGDLNDDNKVNILDVILEKNAIQAGVGDNYSSAADINDDGAVDWSDYISVRKYFLGITEEIIPDYPMQTKYGPAPTTDPYETTPTTDLQPIQTKYGPAPTTDPYEPVITAVTSDFDIQTKYGPAPAITLKEPEFTTIPDIQPEYGVMPVTLYEPITTDQDEVK